MARNSRVRERFELALDGSQIAAVVIGALVVVGAAFGLGVRVGKHLTAAEVAAARSGDLQELDAAGAVARQAVPTARDVTFITELDKQKVVTPPPAERKPVPPPPATREALPAAAREAPPAPVAQPPPPAPAAPAASEQAAAVAAEAPAPEAIPARTAPVAAPAPRGAWSVQLASVPARAEADRMVAKYRHLSPWVEAADIQGKGRYYRVRVGHFGTREDAERYRQDVARETGLKAFVAGAP